MEQGRDLGMMEERLREREEEHMVSLLNPSLIPGDTMEVVGTFFTSGS